MSNNCSSDQDSSSIFDQDDLKNFDIDFVGHFRNFDNNSYYDSIQQSQAQENINLRKNIDDQIQNQCLEESQIIVKHQQKTPKQSCGSQYACNAQSCMEHNRKVSKSKSIKKYGTLNLKRKNYPTQLGMCLLHYLKINKNQDYLIDFQNLKKKGNLIKKYKAFTIKDLRKACLANKESQEFLKDFIKNKFPLYLVQNLNIDNILPYVDFLINSYQGAGNPLLWKGNKHIYKL